MSTAQLVPTCLRCGRSLPEASELRVCALCALEDALQIGDSIAAPPTEPDRPSQAVPASLGKLGEYELFELLGRGGMGAVYKARRVGAEGWAAVKVLAAGAFADRTARERFKREAQALARLRHPGIVEVHDVGEVDGMPFLAMSFVDGPNLAQLVREHPLEPTRAARIVAGVADAVQSAHDQGVLHRDLKPSNVLLGRNDHPQITDFGLAAADWMPRDLTSTGETLGSPGYFPPEQISARRGEVQVASDIYAIGAVLYHLLTGRPPFSAATPADTLDQVLRRQVLAPSLVNPAVPMELEAICLRCLEKKPARRYPRAALLAEDLRRFVDQPQSFAPRRWLGHAWRQARRNHPARAVAFLLLVALAMVGLSSAVGLLWWNQSLRDDLARSQTAAAQEQEFRRELEMRRSRLSYAHQLATAQRAWLAGDLASARRSLGRTDVRQRGWEYRYLQGQVEQYQLRLKGHTSPVSAVAFHPSGKLVASLGTDLTLRLWSVPEGREVGRVLVHGERPTSLAFSSDGRALVTGGQDGTVKCWTINPLTLERQFVLDRGQVAAVDLDPANRLVVAGDTLGRFHLWDRATGVCLTTRQADSAELFSVAFSPGGTTLSTGGRDGTIRVWSVPAGEPLQALAGHREAVRALKYSPDGVWLAAGSNDRTISLWRVSDGVQLFTLAGHQDLVLALDFSREGLALASTGADGTIRFWNPLTGTPGQVFHGHSGRVNSLALSPNGDWFASGGLDQDLLLWRSKGPSLVRPLDGHTDAVTKLEFSPDNQSLLSGSRDGTARIWSLETGQVRRVLKTHGSRVFVASFSPRGDTVVTAGADGRCAVWDSASGQQLRVFDPNRGAVRSLAFASDGQRAASAYDGGGIHIWDVATATPVCELPSQVARINRVQFTAKSSLLYAAGAAGNEVEVWDSLRGNRVRVLRLPQGGQTHMRVGPGGQHLAYGTATGRVTVIDTDSGDLVWSCDGHSGPVSHVAWSPDGERLATCGRDGSLRVWDGRFGFELLQVRGLFSDGFSLAWSRDGHRLAAAGRSGRIWVIDSRGHRAAEPVHE